MMRRSELQQMTLLQTRIARLMTPAHQEARSSLDSAHTVQEVLVAVASKLNRSEWQSYLVGGTLRDLLVHPDIYPSVQPRDLDIIVDGATREELQEVLEKHLVLERFTRFGGLHFSACLSSGSRVLFDVWTLADTWGFHSQGIPPRIEDFPGTTFLNIDSCATELMQPEGRQRNLFEKGFFQSIVNRVLDINYAPNPYPYVCAVRALVLTAQLDFTITPALATYILEHTGSDGVDALIGAQRSHYGRVLCDAAELKDWLHDIRRQLDSGAQTIRMTVPRARRQEFWGEYPKADSHSQYSIPSPF